MLSRKTVRVVAAILVDGDRIFAAQRSYGEFCGGWEFPGGKIEDGETPKEALVREIREELGVEIAVGELVECVEYDYPAFHLSMDCFFARILQGDMNLHAHQNGKWLLPNELDEVSWLPADLGLVQKLRTQKSLHS